MLAHGGHPAIERQFSSKRMPITGEDSATHKSNPPGRHPVIERQFSSERMPITGENAATRDANA